MKLEDKVYIEELEQFGIVKAMESGKVTYVEIKTITGPRIIHVLNLTIKIVTLVEIMMPIVGKIIDHVKKWFKK